MKRLLRRIAGRLRRAWVGCPMDRLRGKIAREFLRGEGLEIGALHHPLPVPRSARVRYVDRMSKPDLLKRYYPDLNPRELVEVDVVDDGETLATVPDASQDFVIANHFLEHCQNPIGTLGRFFAVLRPGGVLYLALPDKRFTFDAPRPVTPLTHLWDDYNHGPERSRREHYEEFVAVVYGLNDPDEVRGKADHYMAADYSIHFHVWSQAEMIDLLLAVRDRYGFDFELVRAHGEEVIFVLRKHAAGFAGDVRRAA